MGHRNRLKATGRDADIKRVDLGRYSVKDPVTYPEWREQKRREAARRRDRNGK